MYQESLKRHVDSCFSFFSKILKKLKWNGNGLEGNPRYNGQRTLKFGIVVFEDGMKIEDGKGNIYVYNEKKEVYYCENRMKDGQKQRAICYALISFKHGNFHNCHSTSCQLDAEVRRRN